MEEGVAVVVAVWPLKSYYWRFFAFELSVAEAAGIEMRAILFWGGPLPVTTEASDALIGCWTARAGKVI